ncbi:MAG: hypothetical protein ACI9J3_003672, partial [Parvicellaceae bacterium]
MHITLLENLKLEFSSTFLIMLLFSSCGQGQNNVKSTPAEKIDEQEIVHQFTNELINESSPYLLQHAHNPVNWHPWGDKALKKAKDENKMLIISVGYAACHWCHVMEHESFEDTAVAKLMNEHFVAIKVDREERPDVDQIYMTAAQLMTGRGGWPLNALALADGKPFYAGTYYPKKDWVEILEYFVKIKGTTPELITQQAEKVSMGIESSENILLNTSESSYSMTDLKAGVSKWIPNYDPILGGGNRAPKFPMPSMWEYMLHYSQISANDEAFDAVKTTLDKMAFGGIYDHVGGGFARYSTDKYWHVPHFEKMLYDNGQLVSLYAHAWQATKNPLYEKVVHEILNFTAREMTSEEGGFYSSLDADSDGEEGKFYVWTKKEIDQALGSESAMFNDYYNVSAVGNWEHGKNILFRKIEDVKIAKKYKLSVSDFVAQIEKGKQILLKERANRIRPGLDDKVLTSWNALMLKGYTDAYRAFGNEKYLKAAKKNASFLIKNAFKKDGGLNRNYKDGKSSIHAFLDDYALVASAFINLYQATFEEKWLNKANELTAYAVDHFADEKSGMFFYTHDEHSNLISRKMEVADNVIPA